ncbi:MAG TPA: penicillin-binding protein activator [Nitrospinota bacterium]|nr:penicillin-binding protein activator [Nitrospinota bacterium]
MYYKKSIVALLNLIILYFLVGCAPLEIKKIPHEIPKEKEVVLEKDFSYAEDLYKSKQYDVALEAYKTFISSYPKNPSVDNALFRIGEILFEKKDYSEALKYYQRILDNFFTSEIYSDAEYKIGLCYYYLGLFERSIATLTKILPQFPESHKKAEIKIFIAKAYAHKKKYISAISEYKEILVLIEEGGLAEESKKSIIYLIEKMDKRSLEEIIEKYPKEFPIGYAQFQLGVLYFQSKKYKEAKTALEGFLVSFPRHKYRNKAMEMLSVLETPYVGDKTKIGAILPLSGKGALAGQKILHGIQLAFSNLELDPAKERFQLIIKDSATSPKRAAEAVSELAIEDKVIAIIGPVFSDTTKEAALIADRYKIPIFSPFAHAKGITEISPYVFRNSLTNEMQGKTIAEYAYNNLGLRAFAVLYPDNPYGKELRDIFISHVIRLGGEIKHVVPYDPDSNDFSKEIAKIGGLEDKKLRELKAEQTATSPPNPLLETSRINPQVDYDAIFIPGYYDKVGLIAPALEFFNVTNITLLGANGWNSPKLVSIGERYIEGSVFLDGFFINSPLQFVKDFVKNYRLTFGEDPDILSAQAYDATEIILKILKTGIETREGLREELLRIKDFPGVSGATTITSSGDSEKLLFILSVKNREIIQIN